MTLLERLRARLAEINTEVRGILDAAEREQRTALTADEDTRYTELRDERERVEARIAQLEDEERRREADAAVRRASGDTGPARVVSEPTTYGRGSGRSYLLDLARAQVRQDQEALTRLTRHAQEMDVEYRGREEARAARAQRQLEGLVENELRSGRRHERDVERFFETRVNPNRTDGQGGYFVPPLWLVDEFIPFLRNGRPFANRVRGFDLPGGTDSINLPKVATGTTTAMQQDNGSVSSTDLTDTFVTAPVRTVAGQQDVAMQLLDQSPINFDEVVFADLLADYAQRVDVQALTGTGANLQLKGINSGITGVNAVTYTNASPTVPSLYPVLGQALSQIQKNRKMKDGIDFFMTGSRWWWIATALDSNNRPLVPPSNAFNPMALADDTAGGPDGQVLTRPVFVDLNIPTNLGTGTNQDQVYATRSQDLYLWEGSPRTRAMTEVLSGTLQVRLQVYNYVAFMPDRYPSSIAVIDGTGLVAPAGF